MPSQSTIRGLQFPIETRWLTARYDRHSVCGDLFEQDDDDSLT
jgi:hypothetical protein